MYRLSRFNKKVKTQSNVAIFNPHRSNACFHDHEDETMLYICCIDPGIKNLCFRISRYNLVTQKSQTLIMEKHDLTCSDDEGMNIKYYAQLFNVLEPHQALLCRCQYIGVESQLPINYDMCRMCQHIITYVMTLVRDLGNKPLILELDPKLKSKLLLAPKKMVKRELKKWAQQTGAMFLRNDGEEELAKLLLSRKKGDDEGDCICYEKCILLLLENYLLPAPMYKSCP